MNELKDLRQGVIDAIKLALPKLNSVEPHAGRFTPRELKEFIVRAPAARVTILSAGTGTPHQSGGAIHEVEVGVYLVAEDRRDLPRDEALLTMTHQVLTLQKGKRFGVACADPALPGRAINLYTEARGAAGADIWAVTWKQPVLIAPPQDPDPDALTAFYYSTAPLVGEDHEDDYTRLPAEDAA